jgi:hypothetical protein
MVQEFFCCPAPVLLKLYGEPQSISHVSTTNKFHKKGFIVAFLISAGVNSGAGHANQFLLSTARTFIAGSKEDSRLSCATQRTYLATNLWQPASRCSKYPS